MTDKELTETILEKSKILDPITKRKITWARINDDYPGVSKALLWKVSRGHIVKDPDTRTLLGLDIMTTIPACPVPGCQETYIHLHGKQTYDPAVQELKPVSKPRARRERVSINKRNMASAARTITNNLTNAQVKELTQNLLTITNG